MTLPDPGHIEDDPADEDGVEEEPLFVDPSLDVTADGYWTFPHEQDDAHETALEHLPDGIDPEEVDY